MITCEELQDLIPAYVLGAVDEADRALVEAHLPRCANCRQLIKDYGPVVDLLPFAAKQVEPRAELRYRILAETMGAPTPVSPVRNAPVIRAESPAPSPSSRLATLFSDIFRSPAFSAV